MSTNYHPLSNEQLLDILSLSDNATAIYVSDQIIIQIANDAMIRFWGKDKTVIGKKLEDAVPELKGQPFIQLLENVWKTGETVEGKGVKAELYVEGKLKPFYFDFKYRAIKNEEDRTYCILHTAIDVTESIVSRQVITDAELREESLNHELIAINEELTASNEELVAINEELNLSQENLRKLNATLAENENRFRNLIQQAPVAIGTLKGRGLIVESANEMILSLWGKTSAVIGKSLLEALPELEGQPFLDILDQVYTSGVAFYGNETKASIQYQGELRDTYFNFVYHPLKNHAGMTNSIMIVATDVTQQVIGKMQLEKITDTLNQAVDSAFMGIWSADLNTGTLTISEQARKMHGIPEGVDLTFAEAIQLISTEYRDEFARITNDAIQSGLNFEFDYLIHPMDGEDPRWMRSTGKTYYDGDHHPLLISGTILNITEQKQDEIRKNDFIGMVSHELKTPLTSLKGYVQLLHNRAKKADDIFTSGALLKVETQVNKMSSMINGFLNISRLESGKIHLIKQDFDLEKLLLEVIDETALLTTGHTIALSPFEQAITVYADREKIGQVVSNFLSNAYKYSPAAENIWVDCQIVGKTVRVNVRDEGIGIAAGDVENLFERYYRIRNLSTQHISGFGIGLYLCAEIIKRHHGKIGVESKLGEGSSFYFTLPY